MLILLPPSESKAADGDGPPIDVGALALPEAAQAREEVLALLEDLCRGPEEAARAVLGLSAAQGWAVRRNRTLADAPALRAADLYTGVLYDRLALPELLASPAAERAAESVLIFSGLWGVLSPVDRVPPYRLSMGVKLPGAGPLGRFWRRRLSDLLDKRAQGEVVVDCRSSTYAAAWRPGGGAAERTVAVRGRGGACGGRAGAAGDGSGRGGRAHRREPHGQGCPRVRRTRPAECRAGPADPR